MEMLMVAVAAGILIFLIKSRWNYLKLPSLPVQTLSVEPDVTIVIPARNEAHQIERVLASFRSLPVIVVDDHSTDGTAGVSRQAGARVIQAPPLSEGARGKPNACLEGARQVTTAWICFVDADTWFEPSFMLSLVNYAVSEKLDLVSVFLDSHQVTAAEKILLPYAFALYFAGVSANAVNNPHSRQALANGQCLLFRREAYWKIGGHGAVIDSTIEDVALAALAKKQRLHTRVVRAEELGHVRMYDGLPAIWGGFRKNSFRFLLVNPLTSLQVIAASILLTSWLPVIALAAASHQIQGRGWVELVLLLIVPSLGLAPWCSKMRWAVFAPAAIYLFQLIALDGMLSTLTSRKAIWKGRHV